MPALDKPLSELQTYRGINPKPADFDQYWSLALAELDATDPKPELIPCDALGAKGVETFDLFFTGVGGARIYAKYLRPAQPAEPGPGDPPLDVPVVQVAGVPLDDHPAEQPLAAEVDLDVPGVPDRNPGHDHVPGRVERDLLAVPGVHPGEPAERVVERLK